MVSKNKSLTELYDEIMRTGGPIESITQAIVYEWERADDDEPLVRQETKKINISFLKKDKK